MSDVLIGAAFLLGGVLLWVSIAFIIFRDARKQGRNGWVHGGLTLIFGVFYLFVYLIVR